MDLSSRYQYNFKSRRREERKWYQFTEYHLKVLTIYVNWVKIANNIFKRRNWWPFGEKSLLTVQTYSFFVMHLFQQLRYTSRHLGPIVILSPSPFRDLELFRGVLPQIYSITHSWPFAWPFAWRYNTFLIVWSELVQVLISDYLWFFTSSRKT